MKLVLANLVYIFHLMLFIPILLSFFYKSGSWLKYNLLIIPFIFLDWYDYDDQCSLTSLEAKLRGTWKQGSAESNQEAPAFFQPLLNKILKPFGLTVSREFAGKINIYLFLIAFIVSYIRYMIYEGLSLFPRNRMDKWYVGFISLFGILYVTNLFVGN